MAPLSGLYTLGWQTYLAIYRLGLKKAAEPHVPVVCVGNLVAGGSGKTPATLCIARHLMAMGRSVVLSASGYGSPASQAAQLAPTGNLSAADWGDEPALFRAEIPDVPIIVGRRRVLAAEICAREFPNAVLLMDDGFQHLPLKKHVTLVLDPGGRNRMCLPAGPYREPWGNRKRADTVLPGEFRLVRSFGGVFDALTGDPLAPGPIGVLTAIGNPARLINSLNAAGYLVRHRIDRPDHDTLSGGTLWAAFAPDLPVVVTLKDWMKLRESKEIGSRQIGIAREIVEIQPADEFRAWLEARLRTKELQ